MATYAALYAQCPNFTNPTPVCDAWLDTMSEEAGDYYVTISTTTAGPKARPAAIK